MSLIKSLRHSLRIVCTIVEQEQTMKLHALLFIHDFYAGGVDLGRAQKETHNSENLSDLQFNPLFLILSVHY